MNLIRDQFIPINRKSGKKEKIAPWQITETEDPIMSLNAPRPDFNGSLMQFLIGLLQTTAVPDNFNKWCEQLENPPKPEELKKHFNNKVFAFETEGQRAFMQDFDPLDDGKEENIALLLIDSPGSNTIKENTDHFVKRDRVEKLCQNCTVTALFTLQINAPTGGRGYRTSLRGGGPLTTLVVLDTEKWDKDVSDGLWLWRNLWINVLDKEKFEALFNRNGNQDDKDIFPWLAEIRTSENDKNTTPQDASSLQMYWSMPRRIRIQWNSKLDGTCDLCGEESSSLIKHYKTKNYGVNYQSWRHTLTPYSKKKDKKGVEEWIAQHPQEGGISYQHWMDCVEDSETRFCAKVVKRYRKLSSQWQEQLRLYAFGYDMDKMKARCWYETTFPLFEVDKKIREDFSKRVQSLIEASNEFAGYCHQVVKDAWFSQNEKNKNIPFVKKQFYQHTEKDFYKLLKQLPDKLRDGTDKEILHNWHKILKKKSLKLFEYWVEKYDFTDSDPKRVVKAKEKLMKDFYSKKIKDILQLPKTSKKK